MVNLITDYIDVWTLAQAQKTSGAGRGNHSANHSLHGIKKLRELILDLAVRGKLVPQNPNDEPASVLLEKIAKEKARLIKEGKIKQEKPLSEIQDEEEPFDLPEGWAWVRLGDIALIQAGFAFKSNSFNENSDGLPLIRIRDVGQPFTGTYYSGKYREEFLVNNGDYLVSMDGQFRVSQWLNGLALLNQRVARLIFFDKTLGKQFIADSLQEHLIKLQGVKAYTTVDHLSGNQISDSIIVLPPLQEQHRIVAKVDELMALCDKLEQQQTDSNAAHQTLVETLLATLTNVTNQDEFAEAWQRIADHFDILFTTEHSIDQLKQTILQLAVMGKLVHQDQHDEPASILLEKIAKEKARLIKEGKLKKQEPLPEITDNEKTFELPDGWVWTRLGEVTNYGISDKAEPDSVDDDTWVLELEDVEKETSILLQKVRFTDRRFRSSKNRFFKGDVIYGKLRPYLDKVIVADEDGVCTTEMIPISGYNNITPQYLRLVMKSPYFISYANDSTHGMNLPRMGTDKARLALFPMVSEAEQNRIVAKVDELMVLCDSLKARINDAQTIQVQLADAIVEQAVA